MAVHALSNARSAREAIARYFITSFADLLFAKEGGQEPTRAVCTATSPQGARAGHPADAVCVEGVIWGRGWIFTVMEGGRGGGVFANNP